MSNNPARQTIHWQPTLSGKKLCLRPLTQEDFAALFAAASDPLIWEQHPDHQRHTREVFETYFRSAIDSNGALAIIDLQTNQIIGSSRFTDYHPHNRSVEIGYTFLQRDYWGGSYNHELKTQMIEYAFQYVDVVYFVVGKNNHRSRRAMSKIGGIEIADVSATPITGNLRTSVAYQIEKTD